MFYGLLPELQFCSDFSYYLTLLLQLNPDPFTL